MQNVMPPYYYSGSKFDLKKCYSFVNHVPERIACLKQRFMMMDSLRDSTVFWVIFLSIHT